MQHFKTFAIKVLQISLLLLLFGCGFSNKETNRNLIEVDLNERIDVSIFDIFERIEIIKLETTDNSLFRYVNKVVCFNNVFYIHDYVEKTILSFDSAGKFLNKIDNRGQGPEEYIHISDFDLDKQENKLLVLDPVSNSLLEYDLTGQFLYKIKLPTIVGAYNKIKCLNDNIITFWTYDDDNRLKLYDKKNNQIFREYFPKKEKSLFDHFPVIAFPYNNYVATESVTDNNIYEISADGKLSIAYTWDFGKLNNNVDIVKNLPKRDLGRDIEARKEISNMMFNSEIVNYFFSKNGGNNTYRYAKLIRKGKNIDLWYKMSEKKTLVFETTKEGSQFEPLYWEDNFVIGLGPFGGSVEMDRTIPDAILDEENLKKKKQIMEDDNPVLIKYYFKK